MTITFTIHGNQEDPKGNPLGYHRTTQGSFWNKGSRKYNAWKQYVVKGYEQSFGKSKVYSKKPIVLEKKQKAYLHTYSYFASDRRSDPGNVHKGIEDALFEDDKYVAGSYDFEITNDKVGKVLVTIIIN